VSGRRALRRSAAAILLGALAARAAPAQDATAYTLGAAPAPSTTLETALTQPGRLVVERTRALPPIALDGGARLVLEAVVVLEPSREQERVMGVRARFEGAGRTGRAALAFLDLHEVEELARSLAALGAILDQERGQETAVEVRHTTRDGFGVAASAGAAPRRTWLRLGGEPAAELAISEAGLAALRDQLDACRRFLFEQ
jgi:hypothetical protein